MQQIKKKYETFISFVWKQHLSDLIDNSVENIYDDRMNYIDVLELFDGKGDIETFRSILSKINIDYKKWWVLPGTKTTKQLFEEIVNNECLVYVDFENNQIFRKLDVVGGKVFCQIEGSKLYLYEEKQVFKNWSVKKRASRMCNSFSEKRELSEEASQTLVRWMEEELDIWVDEYEYFRDEVAIDGRYSNSRPGLYSQYKIYKYIVNLSSSAYKPQWYKEVQEDKTNYFKWMKASKVRQIGYLE